MSEETVSQKLKYALTLMRMAQTTKSPEMRQQHMDGIERILEYAVGAGSNG